MLVPGIIYTTESILQNIKQDGTLKQVENVASLHTLSEEMPDAYKDIS